MPKLVVLGTTVSRGGKAVARLTYSGRQVTVALPDGTVAGRLFRTTDGHPYHYDAWSAAHPVAPTPSDTELGTDLPVAQAIARVLDHARAAA